MHNNKQKQLKYSNINRSQTCNNSLTFLKMPNNLSNPYGSYSYINTVLNEKRVESCFFLNFSCKLVHAYIKDLTRVFI